MIIKDFTFCDTETLMVQTAKSKQAGSHLLMNGGNPVTIFTFQI